MNQTAETAGSGLLSSQNPPSGAMYYRKCVTCPDYGRTCNGPKLAALGSICLVRDFHRDIRDTRQIAMKAIYANANVGESTVNDYFSHSEKDFKWTTVAAIDNALTIICGGRVGQQLLDAPCPASSTELQHEREAAAAALAAAHGERDNALSECQRLREKLHAERTAHGDAVEGARAEGQTKTDYLKDLAENRYKLIMARERTIKILSLIIAALVLALLAAFIGLGAYIAWDKLHPGTGLFW